MISAIVAVNNDWGIGYNGDLLEHIPEDLKYFKELTTGYVVVMGRKTWDSLPKKPLPNRFNVVGKISSCDVTSVIVLLSILLLHIKNGVWFIKLLFVVLKT